MTTARQTRSALPAAVLLAVLGSAAARAADRATGPQITIYNENFALVKETRSFVLKEGPNAVRVSDVTALLEPDSVVLRDLGDPDSIRILEQDYEGDPLSQGFLLKQSEGKILQFQTVNPATGKVEIRTGRVIRSGYLPRSYAWQSFGGGVATAPQEVLEGGGSSPIIEMDGRIQFALPGLPLFETPGADAILKPTIQWTLESARPGGHEVEFSYLTGGMRWEATYNLVAPEKGDRFDLVGWVTLENRSGAEFKDARLKLMAGEVSRARPEGADAMRAMGSMAKEAAPAPPVTEKAFDEYHLYTLQRPTTLADREIKQVEFCRGAAVPGSRLYVYDGAESETKVAAVLEFTNGRASGLGMPLPKGTLKIYRADSDGRREFIGEDRIDHTPADEKVRVRLGNAFDLVGERRQTDSQVDSARRRAEEGFEIKLRNHKKEAVEIRVVEHLYRWTDWRIETSSDPYIRTDSRTAEFRVKVPPDGEKVVSYRVRYGW
jgi:hypothetical protein